MIEKGSVILTFWIPKCATVSGLELDISESGGGNNEGSSVDPIIIRDGVQVGCLRRVKNSDHFD